MIAVTTPEIFLHSLKRSLKEDGNSVKIGGSHSKKADSFLLTIQCLINPIQDMILNCSKLNGIQQYQLL
jgi:hypothetical protein